MTIPVIYTEATLADFMHAELGATATEMGWTAALSYNEAVNSAILEYGVATIALCTNIVKIRAIARYCAWYAVVQAVAADHIYDSAGAVKPSNFHEQALKTLQMAYTDAFKYLSSTAMVITSLRYKEDPYGAA